MPGASVIMNLRGDRPRVFDYRMNEVSQMKFVDQLYELYKNKLTGDEEDVMIVVSGILSELTRDEMIALIKDMGKEEIYQMLGTYMVEKLRVKLVEKGAGVSDQAFPPDGLTH